MFHYKITLNRVHDLIEVREGMEHLILRVDADPVWIVYLINKLEPRLNSIKKEEEAKQEAESIARELCSAIFGKAQMERLFELYNGDAICVISVCSKYFSERLVKLITKAQKRAKL